MNIKRCNNGHFYDADKFESCPHCSSTVTTSEDENNMAIADEFFQKFKSLAKEDNVEAFEYLQKAADLWHKEAVKRIIDLYMRGHCIECIRRPALKVAAKEWQNPEKGISYGLEVEERGINVAWQLMYAYIAIENYEQALHWAKISDSRSGEAEAVQRLTKEAEKWFEQGLSFYREKDYSNALALWEKAGRLDYAPAQFNCGVMYNNGDGTEVNKEKALYWYEKAAEQGDAKAQYNCGIIYDSKDEKESKAKALYWYEKAAEQGNVKAQFICAARYYTGKGTTENKEKALYWGEKAAEQGNVDAQYNCGTMYHKSEGAAKNYEKSLYWFEKAAEQGNTKAQGECGVMYAKGEGTAVDKTKALYWLEKVVGIPKEWENNDTLIYEGYDVKLKEHILGSKYTTEKGRIQDEFAVFWDDSIVNGTPVKIKSIFRSSNMFIITLIAKA